MGSFRACRSVSGSYRACSSAFGSMKRAPSTIRSRSCTSSIGPPTGTSRFRLDVESATLQRVSHSRQQPGAPARFSVESTADEFTSARIEGAVIPTPTGTDLDHERTTFEGCRCRRSLPMRRLHLGQDLSAGHADATLAFTVRSSDLDGVVDFRSEWPPAPGSGVAGKSVPCTESALSLIEARAWGRSS